MSTWAAWSADPDHRALRASWDVGLPVLKSGESCMNSDRVVTLGSNQVTPARVDHARSLGRPFWAEREHGCVSSQQTLKAILHAD